MDGDHTDDTFISTLAFDAKQVKMYLILRCQFELFE